MYSIYHWDHFGKRLYCFLHGAKLKREDIGYIGHTVVIFSYCSKWLEMAYLVYIELNRRKIHQSEKLPFTHDL